MEDLHTLYHQLIQKGMLKSDAIKKSFLANDRADFVPKVFLPDAYYDGPLPIGEGQTISQPTTVVFMLELLQPRAGDFVFDIGAGSGWVTALLAHIVDGHGRVIAAEINGAVGQWGIENLKKYGYKNIDYRIGDYRKYLKELPNFDRIISGAAFGEPYEELVKRLKMGGRMVVPTSANDVRCIVKTESGKTRERIYPGFMFVPITHNKNNKRNDNK